MATQTIYDYMLCTGDYVGLKLCLLIHFLYTISCFLIVIPNNVLSLLVSNFYLKNTNFDIESLMLPTFRLVLAKPHTHVVVAEKLKIRATMILIYMKMLKHLLYKMPADLIQYIFHIPTSLLKCKFKLNKQ